MRKRRIIGVSLRFSFSEIYADGFGQGKCGEMIVNALAYDSEVRRGCVDGTLHGIRTGRKRIGNLYQIPSGFFATVTSLIL